MKENFDHRKEKEDERQRGCGKERIDEIGHIAAFNSKKGKQICLSRVNNTTICLLNVLQQECSFLLFLFIGHITNRLSIFLFSLSIYEFLSHPRESMVSYPLSSSNLSPNSLWCVWNRVGMWIGRDLFLALASSVGNLFTGLATSVPGGWRDNQLFREEHVQLAHLQSASVQVQTHGGRNAAFFSGWSQFVD